MNHAVLMGDSIFDNASYVPGKLPVIEQLRKSLPSDYSGISAIEPSDMGGEKIVQAMVRLLTNHRFESKQSIIYT